MVSLLLVKARDAIKVNRAEKTNGGTPLLLACANGDADVVSVLLDNARGSIDVNQAEERGDHTTLDGMS